MKSLASSLVALVVLLTGTPGQAQQLTPQAPDDVGAYTSLTIRADGLPVVNYWDHSNRDLKILPCANTFCTTYFRRR
jgi:hypothetical protein